MLTIEGDSLNEVWLALLKKLYEDPEFESHPRGMKTRETLGVTLRINELRNNVLYHPIRKLNTKFMCAEWLWIWYGQDDLATLTRYNSRLARFSDNGVTLEGAYGPRLKHQWKYVVDALSKDYFSRQSVASIWTPAPKSSRDIPCTLTLQLIARLGMLNGIVTMRSSDVWLGLPYDVFTFAQLVNGIAGVLGLHTGFLQMQLGSSHLYETDFEKAKQVLDDPTTYRGITSPALPYVPAEFSAHEPINLKDVLNEPKKYIDHGLKQPWAMYADVLNADTWDQGYKILKGERP